MARLVLASSSPYRRTLLERLQLPYQCHSPDVDETPLPGEAPEALALRLAQTKARAVQAHHPASLIIGSDQVASLDGQCLGKPGDFQRAQSQLRAASGQTLVFYTGLCLINSNSGRTQSQVFEYAARFRHLSDRQIEHYLQREQPFNCAGSFKCEGLGIALFDSLAGSDPNTLVGLPLIGLTQMLVEEGVDPLLG